MQNLSFFEQVYTIVRKIPEGKVTNYGSIAVMLGNPRAARAVGYALNAIPKTEETMIPWQRVINAKGQISFKGDTFRAELQRKILVSEGIEFDETDSVDFNKYGWLQS